VTDELNPAEEPNVVAADFERCLELGETGIRDDQHFATLLGLTNYYAARADLHRLSQLLETLRAGLDDARAWYRPVIEALYGNLAFILGDMNTARFRIEAANRELGALAGLGIDMVWFMASDPIVAAWLHLAWALLIQGEVDAAESELGRAAERAEAVSVPQGHYSLSLVRLMEIWIHVEAGQLDRAGESSAELTDQAEFAATQRATVNAMAALRADPTDPAELSECLDAMTELVDTWRAIGMNLYTTFFDAVIARLLIALQRRDEARARIETGRQLADDTGMRFYDAELLRLRGHTSTDSAARAGAFRYARDIARRQGAHLFELRAVLDDFELRGEPAAAELVEALDRIPADSTLPEVARARAALAAMRPGCG
jgi:hypothetical protein